MRYRLRTLLIVLAVGPPLLWGAYALFQRPGTLYWTLILVLAPVTATFLFWIHWLAETELNRRLRSRENLSADELESTFAIESGKSVASSAIEHLRLIGQALGVDHGRLRPEDSLKDLLRPSWLDDHFKYENLEVLLSQRFRWCSQEAVPDNLKELVVRLCERSASESSIVRGIQVLPSQSE